MSMSVVVILQMKIMGREEKNTYFSCEISPQHCTVQRIHLAHSDSYKVC